MENIFTEHQIDGETKTREMKTRIKQNPVSTDNSTIVEARATWKLIADQKISIKNMPYTTSLWIQNYLEKSIKVTTNKTSKNG